MNALIVDNYDSFTYNLYHLLLRFKLDISVERNDSVDPNGPAATCADFIVVSPGPKSPSESGRTKHIVAQCCRYKPILGVCLGMQAINEVFGGRTVHAPLPVHGKTSRIYHRGEGIFAGLPSPFRGARYHSLVCSGIPTCLKAIAHTQEGIPMAFMHSEYPVCGVQYHPESFMTEYGYEVMQNFIGIVTKLKLKSVSAPVHVRKPR